MSLEDNFLTREEAKYLLECFLLFHEGINKLFKQRVADGTARTKSIEDRTPKTVTSSIAFGSLANEALADAGQVALRLAIANYPLDLLDSETGHDFQSIADNVANLKNYFKDQAGFPPATQRAVQEAIDVFLRELEAKTGFVPTVRSRAL